MGEGMGELEVLAERARQLAMAQNFGPEAEQLNHRILELAGDNIGALNRLARCQRARHADDEARASYKRVLEIEPANKIALAALKQLDPPPAVTGERRGTRTRMPPKPKRAMVAPTASDIRISDELAAQFAQYITTEHYHENERGYKLALHILFSNLFRADLRTDEEVARILAALVSKGNAALSLLDLSESQLEQAKGGLKRGGFSKALANLSNPAYAFLQVRWIPVAVAHGMGASVGAELRRLVAEPPSLADRVDNFRPAFGDLAWAARAREGRLPNKRAPASTAFTAAILAGFDAQRYTHYRAGVLKEGLERLAPGSEWPSSGVTVGERYAYACAAVTAVGEALRNTGVPVHDLIDAQSFLWILSRNDGRLHT